MFNKIDQKFTQAYVNKGVSLADLKKYEKAILMYNEAIRIDSKYANAFFHKGFIIMNNFKLIPYFY